MKPVKYQLTSGDIETILCVLSILPSLGLEDTDVQAEINYQCCISAAQKLTSRNPNLSHNDFRIIFGSLKAAQLIIQGEYEVDAETKKECVDHLFTINKLVSVFEPDFS